MSGDHDASLEGVGGVLFPAPHTSHRTKSHNHPILWRFPWPKSIQQRVQTPSNPKGDSTIVHLELSGGVLQHEAAAYLFDIREGTILSHTDNLNTLFWARKGSATDTAITASLLRLLEMHQRYHRYVPRHNYLPGSINQHSDAASRLFHLSNNNFHIRFNTLFPQKKYFHI